MVRPVKTKTNAAENNNTEHPWTWGNSVNSLSCAEKKFVKSLHPWLAEFNPKNLFDKVSYKLFLDGKIYKLI